ncbi:MAG TPA: glycosyltransferase family 2 protein, partial [Vicinamibacterales bacterium]|nr:glycosyltransferase family 2 protein [Vicinamibacterales bacterium]
RVWTTANGRDLDAITASCSTSPADATFVRAALACLAEGGLLERREAGQRVIPPATEVPPATGHAVSAVVNTHTTQWLEGCLVSLVSQRYSPLEVILVDNFSKDNVPAWVAERFPTVRVIRLPDGKTFAQAVNTGVAASTGKYVAILNPDIELDPNAIAECVRVAEADPAAAAVAAKLMFWWAPSFLNGIGNRVDERSWGTDNFIGHLDLGQFDSLKDVPSVCFAATLVRRTAWDAIGPADEAFPLYYEDAEWSYRARLLGYGTIAAPRAVVRHVFGYKVRGGEESDLTPRKLAMAAYGRLRFTLKLFTGPLRRLFVRNYLAEDRANAAAFARAGNWAGVRAYANAWRRIAGQLPSIRQENRRLQAAARLRTEDLIAGQQQMAAGLLWSGVPDLSREVIETHYLPLLSGGRGRQVPEFVPAGDAARR